MCPVNTNLYSPYRHRLSTQMGNRHMFCRPPCWYTYAWCRTRRCSWRTRPRLLLYAFVCKGLIKQTYMQNIVLTMTNDNDSKRNGHGVYDQQLSFASKYRDSDQFTKPVPWQSGPRGDLQTTFLTHVTLTGANRTSVAGRPPLAFR